jgi:hypothetical protein
MKYVQWYCLIHTSNIPSSKCHIHFLSRRPFIQGICPGPRLLMNFHNKLIFLWWGVVSPTPNPKAGRPPLVGCLWLLIQCIHSYLEAVFSILNLRTLYAVVKRDPLNMVAYWNKKYYFNYKCSFTVQQWKMSVAWLVSNIASNALNIELK